MFGPWDVLDHVVDGTVVRYGTPTWRQVVSDGVGKALDAAASGGTPVAVLDVPCYGSPPSGGPDADVRDDPARAGALDGILADAASARPEVRILPVSAVLCPGGHFQDQLDGITLRPDGVHLTKASAELVWRTWLVPRLDSLLAGSTASPAR
jgi:hypothetical protein